MFQPIGRSVLNWFLALALVGPSLTAIQPRSAPGSDEVSGLIGQFPSGGQRRMTRRTGASRAVSGETKPQGESWRYLRHNGHWWYWLPSRRWSWWTGRQWKMYDPVPYARWWAQTHPGDYADFDGRSGGAASRGTGRGWRYQAGDFGYGGFGLGGYGNALTQRGGVAARQRAWSPRGSSLPSLPMGPPGGIPGAGIGYGPYGGPVGRNIPGALGNFGGANMGRPYGN